MEELIKFHLLSCSTILWLNYSLALTLQLVKLIRKDNFHPSKFCQNWELFINVPSYSLSKMYQLKEKHRHIKQAGLNLLAHANTPVLFWIMHLSYYSSLPQKQAMHFLITLHCNFSSLNNSQIINFSKHWLCMLYLPPAHITHRLSCPQIINFWKYLVVLSLSQTI
jgi:hypothetical protein